MTNEKLAEFAEAMDAATMALAEIRACVGEVATDTGDDRIAKINAALAEMVNGMGALAREIQHENT